MAHPQPRTQSAGLAVKLQHSGATRYHIPAHRRTMNGHPVWIIERDELKAAYPREWAAWEQREQRRAQMRQRPQRGRNDASAAAL